MKKLGAFAGIVALLATVAVLSPLTNASGAGGAETLKFTALNREGHQTQVDADGSGDETAGDYFVGNFVLRHGGKVLGHFEFHCDIATIAPNRTLCNGVAHIDGRGEIVAADVASESANTNKPAITGGTGDFGGASGNALLTFGKSRTHVTFTVR